MVIGISEGDGLDVWGRVMSEPLKYEGYRKHEFPFPKVALLLRCGRSERSRYSEAAAGEGVASEGESSGPPDLVSSSDGEEVFHRFQPQPSSSESSTSDEAPPISGA